MDILVGYTGFVGSNICLSHSFDEVYNSKNIESAFGTNPDLLVYSGVPAAMFLANNDKEADKEVILNAITNIQKINPKRLVLISTICVYENPVKVDEDFVITGENLLPYGKHRLELEEWVEKNIEQYTIIRLPGLYGRNIKKNFIYDLIHVIPSMLTDAKYSELKNKSTRIKDSYRKLENGFWKVIEELSQSDRCKLKQEFLEVGFSALNFTDSRGVYQYYNLTNLWSDIEIALRHNIKKLNLAVEPVTISELYQYIKGEDFVNVIDKPVPTFDFYTKYATFFGGSGKYIRSKEMVLEDIKEFVQQQMKE